MSSQKNRIPVWLGIGLLAPLIPWLLLKSGIMGGPAIWIHELLLIVCPPALYLLTATFFGVADLVIISLVNALLYGCVAWVAMRLIHNPLAYYSFLGILMISIRVVSGVCMVLLVGALTEPANVSISECAGSFVSLTFLAVAVLISAVFVYGRSDYLKAGKNNPGQTTGRR
jgi:hypothetical protein